MSPRRKIDACEATLFGEPPVKPHRQWGLPIVAMLAALLMVGAVAVSSLVLASHESELDGANKDREVLVYVGQFMAELTSLDPFHANDYIDAVTAQATGDFSKQFQENSNQILLQVARAEPTKGTVLDAGVERWNDDGSANVLVATAITSKTPDKKQDIKTTTRWVATAKKEGNQWKISNLLQVI